MDHRTWMAALSAETKAALTKRSNSKGLWHLAGHGGAIAVVGTLIAIGVPGWWALLPVQGVLIVFLFTLEHEATHKTPFASEPLNEWVGRLCGLALILPFEWFRYFHLAHHRWTNIEGRDPELEGGKPETKADWLWHVSGLPYWIAALRRMASLARGRAQGDYLPVSALPRIVREARVMLLVYAAIALLAGPLALWVWVVPVLLGQPALRLYLLAEHGDCPRVADMFLNTRTTFTNRVVRFVAWNMPYHTEHHVYPNVPFHQLPGLHAMMRDAVQVTARGYVTFTAEYLRRR